MKELILAVVTLFGSVTTYLFGGWTPTLEVLAWMVVVDFFSGWLAATKERRLSSSIGFIGIARKVLIFFLVAVAYKVDVAFDSPGYISTITIYFYIANEGLSMLENAARLGLPVPTPLRNLLIQIQRRTADQTKGDLTNGSANTPEQK